jgi:hypothetical protein
MCVLGQVLGSPCKNVRSAIAKRGESGLFTFEIFKRSHTHTLSLSLSHTHTHTIQMYNLAIFDF